MRLRSHIPMEGGILIYVSQEEIEQVEYLIAQSIQGNHVLFDPEILRKTFDHPSTEKYNDDDAYSTEPLIERLIALPTLAQKRAFLDKLEEETLHKVVRTYFNIVENNLF